MEFFAVFQRYAVFLNASSSIVCWIRFDNGSDPRRKPRVGVKHTALKMEFFGNFRTLNPEVFRYMNTVKSCI